MTTHPKERFRANAEVLDWQARTRIAVASIAAIGELLLLATPELNALTGIRPIPFILLTTVTYAGVIAAIASIATRKGASEWMVLGSLMADVAFVFAMVAGVSSPQYFDRILVFVFFALYPATWIAKRRHGIAAVLVTVAGYGALVKAALAHGAPLEWPEELWSLGVFVLVSLLMISEHGHLNDRLARIVALFSRAEQGDFSQAYDDAADQRPDAVARVGSAYNRVRAQLADMVLTDPLTGCLNRRGFDQSLAREVARAIRSGSELSLLALDIDHFKAVNDTHGHLAGDVVLREVGALLRRMAREGDIVARTGGEEYSIILPDTSAGGAHHLASRVCDEMRAHRFGDGSVRVGLTVSMGVAAVDRRDIRNSAQITDALKGRADEALYEAKRSGRDRAIVWRAPRGVQLDLGVSA